MGKVMSSWQRVGGYGTERLRVGGRWIYWTTKTERTNGREVVTVTMRFVQELAKRRSRGSRAAQQLTLW
jgi:hypothetical protein